MNHKTNKKDSLITAMILGDGYIDNNNYLSIQHSGKQKDYLIYKMNLLEKLGLKISNIYDVSRNGFEAFRQNCREPELFKYYKHLFYPNKNKTITRNLLNRLDPQGLAIWFMDDGSCTKTYKNGYGQGRYLSIATHSFTKEENELIVKYFKVVWKIDVKIRTAKRKNKSDSYYIVFNATNAPKFIEIIRPYIIESMLYKIDFDYYKSNVISTNEQPEEHLGPYYKFNNSAGDDELG